MAIHSQNKNSYFSPITENHNLKFRKDTVTYFGRVFK